jgi:hypothetical protein
MSSLVINTPEWLKEYGSLLAGYAFAGGMIVGVNELFGPFSAWVYIVTGVALFGVWTVIWFRLRIPPPRNKTDKFGIALFLQTESDDMHLRVENDLARGLQELIASQNLSDVFPDNH